MRTLSTRKYMRTNPEVVIDQLIITQNGTYTAASGHAYSPITVNVSGTGAVWQDANGYIHISDGESTQ